jgi:hypothetical protein
MGHTTPSVTPKILLTTVLSRHTSLSISHRCLLHTLTTGSQIDIHITILRDGESLDFPVPRSLTRVTQQGLLAAPRVRNRHTYFRSQGSQCRPTLQIRPEETSRTCRQISLVSPLSFADSLKGKPYVRSSYRCSKQSYQTGLSLFLVNR